MKDEQDERLYYLSKNVIAKEKFFKFNKRNLIEAIVSFLVLQLILEIMNFTGIVRIFVTIIIGTALVWFMVKGIKNRSVTQILMAEYQFRKRKRELCLRGPEWKRKEGAYKYAESRDEAALRKFVATAKNRLDEFIEQYSEENDS